MDAAERKALIDQYEDGFRAVSTALEAITDAELEAREAPGEWSPREIVHHLADSEMTSAIRLRLLIAQDAPTIFGYDQEAFVRNLYPNRAVTGCLRGRSRGDDSDPAPTQRGAVAAGRHAQRERFVLGRGLAAHLRRPCPRPRRSDSPRTSRGGGVSARSAPGVRVMVRCAHGVRVLGESFVLTPCDPDTHHPSPSSVS
jgi:hypothetical protein